MLPRTVRDILARTPGDFVPWHGNRHVRAYPGSASHRGPDAPAAIDKGGSSFSDPLSALASSLVEHKSATGSFVTLSESEVEEATAIPANGDEHRREDLRDEFSFATEDEERAKATCSWS